MRLFLRFFIVVGMLAGTSAWAGNLCSTNGPAGGGCEEFTGTISVYKSQANNQSSVVMNNTVAGGRFSCGISFGTGTDDRMLAYRIYDEVKEALRSPTGKVTCYAVKGTSSIPGIVNVTYGDSGFTLAIASVR
jgi:hypothetical protein